MTLKQLKLVWGRMVTTPLTAVDDFGEPIHEKQRVWVFEDNRTPWEGRIVDICPNKPTKEGCLVTVQRIQGSYVSCERPVVLRTNKIVVKDTL